MQLTFRPLEKSDFPIFARWLEEPHVRTWWREPATVEHVEKEYGDCTNGDFKTRVYVVLGDRAPIGIVQSYLLEEYPEHASLMNMPGAVGVDYLIGDPNYLGRGLGAKMILQFIDQVVRTVYPEAKGVVADPEVANLASVRALENAGFARGEIVPGEHGPEQLMNLRL